MFHMRADAGEVCFKYTCCKSTGIIMQRWFNVGYNETLSSYTMEHNVAAGALSWANPDFRVQNDTVILSAGDISSYLTRWRVPYSISEQAAQDIATAVVDILGNSSAAAGVRVSSEMLTAVLPVLLPVDIFLADACIRLISTHFKLDAVHFQEIMYMLGSLFSAFQHKQVAATTTFSAFANATVGSLLATELQRYRQEQTCSNVTEYYAKASFATPPGYPDASAVRKCLCFGQQQVKAEIWDIYKCVGQWLLPVVMDMSIPCPANPLQWCDKPSYLCCRPELDEVGRFKVGCAFYSTVMSVTTCYMTSVVQQLLPAIGRC
jgi:hypothetical protein